MQNYQCRGKSYETLIILHITKNKSNNCFIHFQRKELKNGMT